MEGKIESGLNMRDAISTSIMNKLQNVEDELSELSVRQADEQDGRINEGYVQLYGFLLSICYSLDSQKHNFLFCV